MIARMGGRDGRFCRTRNIDIAGWWWFSHENGALETHGCGWRCKFAIGIEISIFVIGIMRYQFQLEAGRRMRV